MKNILKLFFYLCAWMTFAAMILFAVTSFLNWKFGLNLGVSIGQSATREFFQSPDNLTDLLAYEIMLGVFAFISLCIARWEWIWDKVKKHPFISALPILIIATLLTIFFRTLGGDITQGSLFTAIEQNDFEKVEELLANSTFDKEKAGDFFLEAARFDSRETIEVLVKSGYDINAKNSAGGNALAAAASVWYRPEMVNFLIENGASPDSIINEENQNLLQMSILYFDKSLYREEDLVLVIKTLLDKSDSPEQMIENQDKFGQTALSDAESLGLQKASELLKSYLAE